MAKLSRTTKDFDRLNQLYKQIFSDITSGIITVDANKKITSFNVASEEISGYKQSEVLGTKINELFPDLRKIAEKNTDNLGDISTLADPSVVEHLIKGRG